MPISNRRSTKGAATTKTPRRDSLVYSQHQPLLILLTPRRLKQVFIGGYTFIAVALIFGLIGSSYALSKHHRPLQLSETATRDKATTRQLKALSQRVSDFEIEQSKAGLQIIDPVSLDVALADIQIDIQVGDRKQARREITTLQQRLATLSQQLEDKVANRNNGAIVAAAANGGGPNIDVPILMYHYTPPDFDTQLAHLEARGYHAISMDTLVSALAGVEQLPTKPVVISFDDGFSNQTAAAAILRRHHMPAIFYIITGGERSHWCLGANRTNHSCGDGYLSWGEIAEIDKDPLFTIGGHTVDHANLASLSPEDQNFEITANKQELEARLGHAIRHFAYPYGSFNATTISLVKQQGYISAVSTLPGTVQSPSTIYALRRVREALKLP